MRTASRHKSAFTIIELLVVIALIGLLASVVLVFVYEARAKARDIKRVAQAREIKKALDMYLLTYGNYPDVPAAEDNGGGWDLGNINHTGGFIPALATDGAGFFDKTPQEEYFGYDEGDQQPSWTYRYAYYDTIIPCGSHFYLLLIRLERDQTKYNVEDHVPSCLKQLLEDEGIEPAAEWYTIAETE